MVRKIVIAVLVTTVAVHCWQLAQRAGLPFQTDYAEGTLLAVSARILAGQPLSPPLGSFPYILCPYGPWGYGAVAFVWWISGTPLLAPRLFMAACGAVCALLIARIVKALDGSPELGALAAVGFFCNPIVSIWLPVVRVDFLGLMLSLGGFALFVSGRRVAIPAVVFAVAFLTKPIALAAPLSCAIALALERRWRDLLVFVCVGGITVAGTLAWLGPPALDHLLWTHGDPFSPIRYVRSLSVVAGAAMPFLLLTVYGALDGRLPTATRPTAWLYLGASTLLSVSAGKLGAETNHFLEWIAAVAVVAAVTMSRSWQSGDRGSRYVVLTVVAIFAFGVVSVERRVGRDINTEGCLDAYKTIRQSSAGRILSEDVTALVVAGRPVFVSDPFAYMGIRDVNWERGGLAPLLDEGYFDLVVVARGAFEPGHVPRRWSSDVGSAIAQHYRMVGEVTCSNAVGAFYVRNDSTSDGRR